MPLAIPDESITQKGRLDSYPTVMAWFVVPEKSLLVPERRANRWLQNHHRLMSTLTFKRFA